METHNTKTDEFDSIKPAAGDFSEKSVGEPTGKFEIIVKEKKGFFSSAIPLRLPCGVAVLCCFLNCVVPGLGTFISAPFTLCEKDREKGHVRNFFVNVLAAFLQLLTAIIFIGWLWSIMWAIEFLKPLKEETFEE